MPPPTALARPVSPDRPAPGAAPTEAVRPRQSHHLLVSVFAALLFVFPSEVAAAGPLKSNGAPVRLIGLGLAVLLLLDLLRRRRPGQETPPAPVVVLVLAYLAGQVFFYGWGTFRSDQPADLLRDVLFSVSACGVAVFTALRVKSQAAVHQVLGLLVAGCTLSALVGVAQAVGTTTPWVDLVTLPGFQQLTSVDTGDTRYGLTRVLGTASHPIEYGVLLGACLPFALHLALHAAGRRARRLAGVAALLMAVAVPFALSRGGLICIAAAAGVFLTVQPWRVRTVTLGAVVITGCTAFVVAPTLSSALVRLFLSPENDASIGGRVSDYAAVDAAFSAAPWLGGAPLDIAYLDNQWLVLLAQRGMVGVILFALLIAVPLAGLVATCWRLRGGDQARRSLAAALAGALVSIAISGGVFDLMSFGQAAMLLFLVVGLSAAVHVPPGGDPPAPTDAALAQRARWTVTGSPVEAITLPPDSGTRSGAITGP